MTVGRRHWAVVGVALVVGGVVAWVRRADSRVGPVIAFGGFAWLSGTVLSAALFWHRGPLICAVLAHPTGRPSRALAKVVIGLGFVDAAVVPLARADWVTIFLAVFVGVASVDGFVGSSGPARRASAVALGAVPRRPPHDRRHVAPCTQRVELTRVP